MQSNRYDVGAMQSNKYNFGAMQSNKYNFGAMQSNKYNVGAMQSNRYNIGDMSSESVGFIFRVRRLEYSTEERYVRYRRDYRWIPPQEASGFRAQPETTVQIYQWRDGNLSILDGIDTSQLRYFGVASMFWHSEIDRFLAVNFDASKYDATGYHDWREVEYNHKDNGLTIIESPGEKPRIGRPGNPQWLDHVVPKNHDFDSQGDTERAILDQFDGGPLVSCGISGRLPIVIGSMAYSCPEDSLGDALNTSFKKGYWNPHNYLHDRHSHRRGKIIEVWYDINATEDDRERLERYSRGDYGAMFA